MVTDKSTIWEQITRLAKDIPCIGLARVGRKLELSRKTDLVRDLGLVGDDAFEFMGKYASCLNVEKGDYDSSVYFDEEGLWLLPRFGRKKAKMPITLGMLELAASDGKWNSARLHRAYLNNSYPIDLEPHEEKDEGVRS